MSTPGFTGQPAVGLPQLLAQSAVAIPLTGTLVKTAMATIVIPAGVLGKNGSVEVEALFSQTNNANTKNFFMDFGALNILSFGVSGVPASNFRKRVTNRGAINAQVATSAANNDEFTQTMFAPAVGAVDTSAAVAFALSAQLTNVADVVTLEAYRVLLFPKG